MKKIIFILIISWINISFSENKWVTLDSGLSYPILKVDVNSVKTDGNIKRYLRQWWDQRGLVDTMYMEIDCKLDIQRAVPNVDYFKGDGTISKTNETAFDTSWKTIDFSKERNKVEKLLVCKL